MSAASTAHPAARPVPEASPKRGSSAAMSTGAPNCTARDTFKMVPIEVVRAPVGNSSASMGPKFDHVPVSEIPPDAVTSSGSGLDPDISPANAQIQVARVAAARHLPVATVQSLVSKNTDDRAIGFLGEPGVNVLKLNIALDSLPKQ